MATATDTVVKGGSWLLGATEPESVFTPEKLTDEHRMMFRTAADFVVNEVQPNLEQLETKDWALARRLVRRAGELGLLGTDVPEAYGGVELDKVSSIVVADGIAPSASFGGAFGSQTGLAIMPFVCFANEQQKKKYLPALTAGTMVGAYALSESGSGSDALGAKTRAVRQADGSFVLNGEKMWITNGGFADVFIVFAKVDGEHFTAFIVERDFPGVSSGKEEHKMGLHGSSTTPLILQDAQVPAENLLGEIGKGHKIAFNTLNYGRLKLGAMAVGGARGAIGEAVRYAAQRRQFGQAIASFGAIKHKIAEMNIKLFAVESLLYRTAAAIDNMIASAPGKDGALQAALEEFAIESSIAKVMGSEMIDFVLDENVQIHGGNGFVRDYPAERHYRDARVNRIFEGTNEINRLLIPGMLIRRALKGDIALIPAAKKLQEEILSPSPAEAAGDGPLDEQHRTVSALKKTSLLCLGAAMQARGEKLTEEQEVLTLIADVVMDTYASESVVLRASESQRLGHAAAPLQVEAARVFVNDAAARVEINTRQVLSAVMEGDTLRAGLGALRRLLKATPINTVAPRRAIAEASTAKAGYILGS